MVSSGQYSLVPNYADLWGVANENNAESVFELQYKAGGTGTGSQFTDYYTPFGGSGGVGAGNAPQVLSPGIDQIHSMQYMMAENDARGMGGTFAVSDEGNVYVKKWESIPFAQADADNNFPVFRYADVLLMLAEALGEGGEAYMLINQVRARAGASPIDAGTPGTFQEKLLFERQLEFITEGKRWADLLRFGVAQQVMSSFEPLQGGRPLGRGHPAGLSDSAAGDRRVAGGDGAEPGLRSGARASNERVRAVERRRVSRSGQPTRETRE